MGVATRGSVSTGRNSDSLEDLRYGFRFGLSTWPAQLTNRSPKMAGVKPQPNTSSHQPAFRRSIQECGHESHGPVPTQSTKVALVHGHKNKNRRRLKKPGQDPSGTSWIRSGFSNASV
jgi:hypothetical protein